MSCTVDAPEAVQSAAASIEANPCVDGIDVVPPAIDPTDCWTVEVTLAAGFEGVPPIVSRTFGRVDATVWDVGPRGDRWVAIVLLGEGRDD